MLDLGQLHSNFAWHATIQSPVFFGDASDELAQWKTQLHVWTLYRIFILSGGELHLNSPASHFGVILRAHNGCQLMAFVEEDFRAHQQETCGIQEAS